MDREHKELLEHQQQLLTDIRGQKVLTNILLAMTMLATMLAAAGIVGLMMP